VHEHATGHDGGARTKSRGALEKEERGIEMEAGIEKK
jgi:hypothetical protein